MGANLESRPFSRVSPYNVSYPGSVSISYVFKYSDNFDVAVFAS